MEGLKLLELRLFAAPPHVSYSVSSICVMAVCESGRGIPMKNWILMYGAIALGVFALWGDLQAAVYGDFEYQVDEGNRVAITGYHGPGGEVEIPESMDGMPVTGIQMAPFIWNETLTGILIPDTVEKIERSSFSGCSNLASVRFPAGLTRIGESAFRGCISLSSVTLPAGLGVIESGAFSGCTSLADLTIPEGVHFIGMSAFLDCSSLTSVMIPSSVTTLGNGAFGANANLMAIDVDPLNPVYRSVDGVLFSTELTILLQYPGGRPGGYVIPDTVTEIGPGAFSGADKLTEVTIPGGVSSIGSRALRGNVGLTAIHVDQANPYFESVDGILFSEDRSTLIQYPAGYQAGDYAIPDSVGIVGSGSFYNCHGLSGVTIPDTVHTIEQYAFYGCDGLVGVLLPDSVGSLGDFVFSWCTSLVDIELSSGLTSIPKSAFVSCASLTDVIIPASVERIEDSAFRDCTGLSAVVMPSSLVSIGKHSFRGCSSLAGLTLPASVTIIGTWAFQECPSLESIYFEGDMPEHGSTLFEGTSATIYYIEGTADWKDTFAGLPTVKQFLPIMIEDFEMVAEGVRFTITGAPNIDVVIEAAGDPGSGNWMEIFRCRLIEGACSYTDTREGLFRIRFYRVRRQ